MALPPATFKTSRLITTAISTLIWWVLLYLTGVFSVGGSTVTHAAPLTMAIATLISILCVPYFATHSVLMGGLRRVLKGKIILPDSGVDAGASAGNAWRAGAINVLIFGVVPAVAGFVLANGSTTALSARQFGVRLGTGGALLAAVVVFIVAGRPLLEATRVPRNKPRFNGDPKPYLRGHFVVPHAIINFVLNAALAFQLSPVPFAAGTAMIPVQNVILDTAIAFVVLTWIIGSGARSQARTEAEWGFAPPAAAAPRSVLASFLTPLLGAAVFTVVIGLGLWLTHTASVGIYSWALYRGVVFGVYAAVVSQSVAQAAIHATLHPAAAAVPVKTEEAA